MKELKRVVIIDGKRTPFGKFLGGLSGYSATDLAAMATRELLKHAGVDPGVVDFFALGQVMRHTSGQHPARMTALEAGLPHDGFTAVNLNQACGSGLTAAFQAYLWIATGQADAAIGCGAESMSNAPHMIKGLRKLKKFGPIGDVGSALAEASVKAEALDVLISDGLADWTNNMMGDRAGLVADDFDISRKDMDEFAVRSHQLAAQSRDSGYFDQELFSVAGGSDPSVMVSADEGVRQTSVEELAELRPAFPNGGDRVTAGNASQLSDGAGAVLLMSDEKAGELGLEPLAEIIAFDSAPEKLEYVLVAPIISIPRALARSGMEVADIDLFEVNEAFCSSTLAVQRKLDIPMEKLNICGGATALGHPVGASGSRLLMHSVYDLIRLDKQTACVSLCLGGAEAVTMIVRRTR